VVIRQELRQRGIADDLAESALAEISDEQELQRALAFARRKAERMRSLDGQTAVRRLSAAMMRKGFHWSIALSVAREVVADLDDGAPAADVEVSWS
jgi:regulatory protein